MDSAIEQILYLRKKQSLKQSDFYFEWVNPWSRFSNPVQNTLHKLYTTSRPHIAEAAE